MPRLYPSTQAKIGLGSLFRVEFDGVTQGYFTEVSGLSITVAVEKYEEGGLNHYTHQLPGRASYGNITLREPLFTAATLYEWVMKVLKNEDARKDMSIAVLDPSGDRVRTWNLMDAFPVKWEGPSFKVATTEAAIQTLELAHHGLSEV